MMRQVQKTYRWPNLVLAALFYAITAHAQAASPGAEGVLLAQMQMIERPMGMWFMILCVLLIVTLVAALIALTIFLVRRSRPPHSISTKRGGSKLRLSETSGMILS